MKLNDKNSQNRETSAVNLYRYLLSIEIFLTFLNFLNFFEGSTFRH